MSADKTIAASATEKLQVIPAVPVVAQVPTGLGLYSRFAFAGAVCCAVTHGGLTPGNNCDINVVEYGSDVILIDQKKEFWTIHIFSMVITN